MISLYRFIENKKWYCFFCMHILSVSVVLTSSLSAADPGQSGNAGNTGSEGSDAGNGGGISEKNILFAAKNLGHYLDLYLASQLNLHLESQPNLNLASQNEKVIVENEKVENDQKLLTQIKNELDVLKTQSKELTVLFQSNLLTQGSFIIDGQPRIARTGSQIGDPIYINRDLIYPIKKQGHFQVIDIPTAVSILVHELGHHHEIKDHQYLDLIGTKLQSFLYIHMLRAEFWNSNAAFITIQNNIVTADKDKGHLYEMDQVLLENRNTLTDLQSQILSQIQCPQKNQKPFGLRIYNIHEERGVQFNKKTQVLMKPAQAWYILSCKKDEESDHGDLELSLFFKKVGPEKFEFLPEQFRVIQKSCLQFPKSCK